MRWYETAWVWLSLLLVVATGTLSTLAGLDVVSTDAALLAVGPTLCWLVLGAMPMVISARRSRNLGPERNEIIREAELLSDELTTSLPYRFGIGPEDDGAGALILSSSEEKHLVYRALVRVIHALGVEVDD